MIYLPVSVDGFEFIWRIIWHAWVVGNNKTDTKLPIVAERASQFTVQQDDQFAALKEREFFDDFTQF